MTPIGHLSTSYIVAKTGTNLVAISTLYCLIGGILPDIDFLSYFWGELNNVHRTYTHSIGFLLVSLAILYLLIAHHKKYILFSFSLGFILHLIIDAGMDGNYSNGIGIPMLWPFYDNYIYWFTPSTDNTATNTVSWLTPLQFVKEKTLHILLIELPFYLYAIILLKKSKYGQH